MWFDKVGLRAIYSLCDTMAQVESCSVAAALSGAKSVLALDYSVEAVNETILKSGSGWHVGLFAL